MGTAIGVRSPFFVSHSAATAVEGTLALTISGSLAYTITKDVVPGTTRATFDISELVRDYIQPRYDGSILANDCGAVIISYTINLFNSAGGNVGSDSGSYDAFDAYQYYYNGNNYNLPTGALITGLDLWVPIGEGGVVFSNSGTDVTTTSFTSGDSSVLGVPINRFPCGRYGNYPLTYLNRFGVHQQMWFTAKTVTSLSVTGSKYKSKYNAENGGINGDRHQYVDYNRNGLKQYTLNTDYITTDIEDVNNQLQELLLSEYVWIDDLDLGLPTPVNVLTSNVTFKTGLNDRLVSYQVTVQTAYDLISTGR